MFSSRADIIERLKKDILPLQGFRPALNEKITTGLGLIERSFPNNTFPLGAIHEFICHDAEAVAASAGFIAGIVAKLMQHNGTAIWIGSPVIVFPVSLKSFGIDPDKIIFVNPQNEKQVLWAMEESLKCNGLTTVIGEIPELSFTVSRRFQLAVEQSGVTGFVVRKRPRNLTTTACITRWKITSLPSRAPYEMPGVGFPCWNVELLKVRNGRSGVWKMEWRQQQFHHIPQTETIWKPLQRKTG